MKLSAKARYAARLLLDLALHPDETPLRASKLSESTDISVQFIEQIIRPLKRAGLVKSVRGASGGHILDKAPEEITLGQIVRIMEGDIELTACCGDPTVCPRSEDCRTRMVWEHVSRVIERELDAVTLADLMKNPDLLRGQLSVD